jgi:hypothetical protein
MADAWRLGGERLKDSLVDGPVTAAPQAGRRERNGRSRLVTPQAWGLLSFIGVPRLSGIASTPGLSRMLLGGPGPDGSDPRFKTQGAIFYEVRSVGQKSNGMLEQLFVRPTMAVLAAAADGSLYAHPGTGWEDIPFGQGQPCGGGPS